MTESWRAHPLVLEMARRLLILEGRRTELPPKEFELLAALAARPGEAVSAKELIKKVWPESSVMTPHDLYWYVWSLRKLIGDGAREDKLIANRRGVGYYLDLPPNKVEILEKGHIQPEEERLEPPAMPPTADSSPSVAANTTVVPVPMRNRLASTVIAAAATGVIALSSFAGYWLSRVDDSTGVVTQARVESSASPSANSSLRFEDRTERPKDEQSAKHRRKRKNRNRPGNGAGEGAASSGGVLVAGGGSVLSDGGTIESGGGSGTPPTTNDSSSGGSNPKPDSSNKNGPSGGDSKPTDNEPQPPPPQPDATLYHLYDPQSGDHIATTSSATADQKEAYGYRVSREGYVFTSKEKGTSSISLSSGTAYVYSSTESAPSGLSVSVLYRVNAEGGTYYTSSTSEKNQAAAYGWSSSTAGYIQR